MTRKTMSIRGEEVDFDKFVIKQQLANTPKAENIKNRERFIDKRRRKLSRDAVDQLLAQQQQTEAIVREALMKQKKISNDSDTSTVPAVQPIVKK